MKSESEVILNLLKISIFRILLQSTYLTLLKLFSLEVIIFTTKLFVKIYTATPSVKLKYEGACQLGRLQVTFLFVIISALYRQKAWLPEFSLTAHQCFYYVDKISAMLFRPKLPWGALIKLKRIRLQLVMVQRAQTRIFS